MEVAEDELVVEVTIEAELVELEEVDAELDVEIDDDELTEEAVVGLTIEDVVVTGVDEVVTTLEVVDEPLLERAT